MSKKLITAVAAATLSAAALATPVMAETTATAGFVSDYVFRGGALGDGGANASIDWANDGGFSAGIWAIDDQAGGNDGLEFDLYAAYGMEVNDDLALSIGYTSYQYTYTSQSQNEVNLGASFKKFGLAVDIGTDTLEDRLPEEDIDYQHIAVSYAHNDIYSLTAGQVDPDTDTDDDQWTYVEVGAAGEVSDLDVSLTVGHVETGDAAGNLGGYMVLSVSKTFDDLGL